MAFKISIFFLSIIHLNYVVAYAHNKPSSNINNLEKYEEYHFNKQWCNEKFIKIYRPEDNKVKDQSNFLLLCPYRFFIYSSSSDRQKRSPKIYPRTTVTLFGRKTRNNNQLEVRRRSINKRKFQSSHSPGIKQLPPKPKPHMIVKRSIDKDYIGEDKSRLISTTIIAPTTVVEPLILSEQTIDLSNINEETTLLTETQTNQNPITYTNVDTTPLTEINPETNKHTQHNSESEKETTDETKKCLNSTNDLIIKNNLSVGKNNTFDLLDSTVATSTSSFDEFSLALDHNHTLNIDITTPKHLEINNTHFDKSEFEKEVNRTTEEHFVVNKTGILNNTDINKNTTQTQINKVVTSELLTAGNDTVYQETTQNITTIFATSTQASKEISTNQTTTETETSSMTSAKPTRKPVKRIKQIKPSQEMEKWAKTNLHQLAVISVPYRKCPHGQRIRKGKCVQVY